MALIRIRNLVKHYRMGDSVVRALDGVNLDISQGEFVAIIGPSGSGKSTMMHLLGCLDRPTAGQFLLDGRDVGRLSDRQLADLRNKSIGFVFQTFNLINRTSALDNIRVPLFYARQAQTVSPARVALERVGLAHREHHRPSELSGGERQRVAIARAIVNNPVLLLADEPTGNLDSKTGDQIMDVFRSLNAQGVTVVIVTHEPDIALQARRIVAMRDGKIVSDMPAEQMRGQFPATPQLHHQQQNVTQSFVSAAQAAAGGATEDSPELAEQECIELQTRRAGGANASLVLGALGLVLAALAAVGIWLVKTRYTPAQLETPPPEVLAIGGATFLGFILAFVLGVLTIFVARSALQRCRTEPNSWHGSGRARAGLWLGVAATLSPVVLVAGSQAI